MGRIKEISRKSAHTRKRNPVVYLICEGSETEIRYFKRFRSRGCNIDIIPISSQYKSADRLVQKAKATMGNNPYYPEDGDSIWCVFDRDDNSNEVLLRAKQSAQKEGYHLAYSNPSFELWFLLHFVNQQAEVEDCQALIRLLKQPGRLPDYEKNKDLLCNHLTCSLESLHGRESSLFSIICVERTSGGNAAHFLQICAA